MSKQGAGPEVRPSSQQRSEHAAVDAVEHAQKYANQLMDYNNLKNPRNNCENKRVKDKLVEELKSVDKEENKEWDKQENGIPIRTAVNNFAKNVRSISFPIKCIHVAVAKQFFEQFFLRSTQSSGRWRSF